MFFALTELEHHPILFDLSYAPGEIDFGEGLAPARAAADVGAGRTAAQYAG